MTPAAPRSLAARVRALGGSVWAPVLARSTGVLLGMLALAAIGASSLARGSGVPLAPASARPGQLAVAGFAGPVGPHPMGVPAAPAGGRAPAARTSPLEAPAGSADAGTADGGPPAAALTADGKVILNRAGVEELRRLPGIGSKRALAILALRRRLGRFKRVTDLLRVKGIGPKGLRKLAPHVVLDAPPEPR